jgi:cupin 2 domain-containing protein
MAISVRNLLDALPDAGGEEEFLALFASDAVRIERIVSRSYRSPDGFWYDQDEDEWVVLLRGYANLEFAAGEALAMKAGDSLLIPRHVKHRVKETGPETIWLAVHVKAGG